MSQLSITSFFSSRKRAATDDVVSARNKVQVLAEPQATPRSGSTYKHVNLLSNKKELHAASESAAARGARSRAVAKLSFDEPTAQIEENKPATPTPPSADFQSSNATSNPLKSAFKSSSTVAFLQKKNAANVAKNLKDVVSDSVSEGRKELSLGDLKAKLAGSSRLANLKASAECFSRNYQLLKAKSSLKEFKSIDVEVPTSPSKRIKLQDSFLEPIKTSALEITVAEKPLMSPRKVVVSPVKSPSKVPAYIRHASLATKTTSLPLPHHYRSLAEIFKGMEQVASLLYNRKEKITFGKLRPSVQEMLKKNFTEKHLEQLKHLVPEFYSFEIEKAKIFSASTLKQTYDLIIVPILPPGVTQMSPKELLDRRQKFYNRLLELTKEHHSKFLLKLDPPMVIPNEKLMRWHPEFELQKVPDVDCSKLPEMPGKETYSTAEDVLTKAREMFSCNTRLERALENLATAKARGLTDKEKQVTGLTDQPNKPLSGQTAAVPSVSNITLLNPALRNLPASLLEKIKAKQAAKALEAMTRTTEDEKKYLIYSRLPDLARTLRNIFVTERKNVLALNVVLSKLESSFKARVSESDLRKDIDILSEEVPGWVSLQVVRNVQYLKLDRAANLENIKQKLQILSDKYKP